MKVNLALIICLAGLTLGLLCLSSAYYLDSKYGSLIVQFYDLDPTIVRNSNLHGMGWGIFGITATIVLNTIMGLILLVPSIIGLTYLGIRALLRRHANGDS